MRSLPTHRVVITIIALGVVIGCGSLFEHLSEQGAGSGSFAVVDSNFANGNVSVGDPPDVDQSPVEGEGEETLSFFTAFQMDPGSEDSAGPKFASAGDADQDGLVDIVTAWNQSQPVQLHLQQRDEDGNISFRSITIAGTSPVAVVAGVEMGNINGDAFPDIVVLVKATGSSTLCPSTEVGGDPTTLTLFEGEIIIYINPANDALIPNGARWDEIILSNPLVIAYQVDEDGNVFPSRWIHDQFPGRESADFNDSKTKPELSGFTALKLANIDGNDGDEIIVGLNAAECEGLLHKPALTMLDLWINPGGAAAEDPANWGVTLTTPAGETAGAPITIEFDLPDIADIEVSDIDSDGDLDIISTFTNSISRNIRWSRNPLIPDPDSGSAGGFAEVVAATLSPPLYVATGWEQRPVGTLDTGANLMALGDIDADGFDDVVVRSTAGQIVQWFRRPTFEAVPPEFPPPNPTPDRTNFPWQVYTLTEFTSREPEAISVGDIDGDGRNEVLVAAEGAVLWFDESTTLTPFDPWLESKIIQDGDSETTSPGASSGSTNTNDNSGGTPGGSGVGVTDVDVSTHINALLIVDIDGDGFNDVIGTLDRRSGAGLSDDRLVWYRNTLGDE
ncbi:MAG: VCBS repeat-containing protein [Phycisphaerales bacterium]|nr:VCBS repeat-containing protein [Phycisphaerales bacterium]